MSISLSTDNLDQVLSMLISAGEMALKYWKNPNLKIKYKEDKSPVTNADIEISEFIIDQLSSITPNIITVSEENTSSYHTGHTFWLLDPIDGTRNYINQQSNYTINLSLVSKYLPVLGFIYHPSLNEIYYNDPQGSCIFYDIKTDIKTTCYFEDNHNKIRVLIDKDQKNLNSISEEELFFKIHPGIMRNKISMLLTDEVDVFYLYRPSMEWDTAAGHSILRTIGGDIIDLTGHVLIYGKPLFYNTNIILCNQKSLTKKEIILNNI